jgi:hypothetical protein
MPKHMPLLNYIHSTHIQDETIIYKQTNLMLDYCKPPLESKTLIALSPHDFVIRPNYKRTFVRASNVTIHVVVLWHRHHNSCIHLNLVSPIEQSGCGSNMSENMFKKKIRNFDNCIGICNLYK